MSTCSGSGKACAGHKRGPRIVWYGGCPPCPGCLDCRPDASEECPNAPQCRDGWLYPPFGAPILGRVKCEHPFHDGAAGEVAG